MQKLVLLIGLVSGLSATAQNTTISFTADETTNISNPERGFIGKLYPVWTEPPTPTRALTPEDCERIKTKSWSVIGVRYVLYHWRTADLSTVQHFENGASVLLDTKGQPQTFLERVAQDCAVARAGGIKLAPSIAYYYANGGYEGQTDTSIYWVLRHIDELLTDGRKAGPYIVNKDVIASIDVGFIGKWGEEHSSTNDLLNSPDPAAYDTMGVNTFSIWNALLSKLPNDRMISGRYPAHKLQFFDKAAPLTNFSSSFQGRMAHHNDSFLGSDDDVSTYQGGQGKGRIAELKNYIIAESPYVRMGGEPYGAKPKDEPEHSQYKTDQGALVAQEMEQMHFDHFNGEMDERAVAGWTYDRWKKQGFYDLIQRKLGYRFTVNQSRMEAVVKGGQVFTVKLDISNLGWGKMYNPRPVNIIARRFDPILKDYAETHSWTTHFDPRSWQPKIQHKEAITLALPSGMIPGRYSVYLSLPDASPSLQSDHRYAVKLASSYNGDQIFNPSTGLNWIGSIQVED